MRDMKLILSGVFTLIATVLFFVQCGNNNTGTTTSSEVSDGNSGVAPEYLPIAYVDSDSILTYFNFYSNMVGKYEEKVSKQSGEVAASYRKFQDEVVKFEQKVQNNQFFSQDRYNQEQARLQRMQKDIEKKSAQIEQDLMLEQSLIQQQFSDSLALGIKEFNTPQKFQMIFTKSGNNIVLYADPHYNITEDVIDFLNNRFKVED